MSTVSTRRRLVASRLGRAGGVIVTRLVDEHVLAALRAEAFASRPTAALTDMPHAPADGEQRGQPDRRIAVAVGGPALAALFTSPAIARALAALTDVDWEPLGNQGTYSFYGPGAHLGIHRDAPRCDLSLITCLHDDGPPGAPGGELTVYPGRATESMASIRADPATGAHRLRLEPGQSAILLGGLVPHRVTRVERGRLRVVAPLCYTAG